MLFLPRQGATGVSKRHVRKSAELHMSVIDSPCQNKDRQTETDRDRQIDRDRDRHKQREREKQGANERERERDGLGFQFPNQLNERVKGCTRFSDTCSSLLPTSCFRPPGNGRRPSPMSPSPLHTCTHSHAHTNTHLAIYAADEPNTPLERQTVGIRTWSPRRTTRRILLGDINPIRCVILAFGQLRRGRVCRLIIIGHDLCIRKTPLVIERSMHILFSLTLSLSLSLSLPPVLTSSSLPPVPRPVHQRRPTRH